MNWTTIVIGLLALGVGFYCTYLRLANPQKLAKLDAMKQKFGPTTGNVIHTVFYSVLPVVVGVVFIVQGVRGIALF